MPALRLLPGLLVAGLLAGCGSGDSAAAPAPPPPSPAAATATATPTAGAEQQAVERAVRRYFEGFNLAFDSGDPQQLAAGSTQDCGCRAVVDGVAAALADGARVEGNRYTVEQVQVRDVEAALATASAVVSSTAGREVDRAGRTTRELDAQASARKELVLRKEEQGWLVFSIADA